LASASFALAEPIVLVRDTQGIIVDSEDVLTEARQRKVPESTLNEALKKPDNIRRMASNIYIRRVLASQAESAGLTQDPVVKRQLVLAREKTLSDIRLAQVTDATMDAASIEQLAKHEYSSNTLKFSTPETVRVRHILVDDKDKSKAREQAQSLLAKLRSGEDFAALAQEFSIDPGSKPKGGDLGFFARGSMVKPFEEAAFALKNPGDLSDIVETQFGFHILRLEEHRAATLKPYDEVAPQIRKQVEARVKAERHRELVTPIEQAVPAVDSGIEAFAAKYR
jgi:peptidyl-prolyl cis-trans isomerase C